MAVPAQPSLHEVAGLQSIVAGFHHSANAACPHDVTDGNRLHISQGIADPHAPSRIDG